jgi:hypothetical protein
MTSLTQEFGRNSTPAEIKSALTGFDYNHNGAPSALLNGAIEALREGKPENLATIIVPKGSADNQTVMSFVRALSLGLTAEEAKTLTAGLAASHLKTLVDSGVYQSLHELRIEYTDPLLKGIRYFGVDMTEDGKIAVLEKLIALGADMGAKDNGFLQTAVANDLDKVADFIVSKGGSFEKAIENAKCRNDVETFYKLTILSHAREITRLKAENAALQKPAAPKGDQAPGSPKA